MNAKAAVEENQDGVNSAEEIIELQDLRMSPIPSLRNRHKAKYYKEPGGKRQLENMKIHPSLSIEFDKTELKYSSQSQMFLTLLIEYFLVQFQISFEELWKTSEIIRDI